ncbi:MAG TPA: DUF3160 domain-containing protein, partial [Candidatus Eisenbacteria bacterium]|nr:DUF3160 domain-containing protein [Candidatus Eisenbacteria bacterium]
RTPDKAPAFMKRAAWEEKEINTALGAWVEMVNLTSPFTKDANVYMSASPMMDRFHGWVEPFPNFYARLDSMVVTLANRLAGAGMFDAVVASRDRVMATFPPEKDPAHRTESDWRNNLARDEAKIRVTRDLFDELSEILKRCQAISRRELSGEGQTIGDGVFLKSLRERFKRLAFNRSNSVEAREPMGVVADPATEYQSHQCWEVATGKPHALYVAVPDGDRTFVCLGAVYSYHEFTRPMNQRLDDTNWRAMLKQRDADLPPAWGDSRPALRPTEPVRASMYGAR